MKGRDRIRLSQHGRNMRVVREHINELMGFIKCGKITRVAQELLASHERPCSMKCDHTVEKRLSDRQSTQNFAYRNVRCLLL